ncbi:hypothetical protein [Ornithinimicrobium faecis]|uniref:hypothetical protein n=1 Tax=Ornithinimicrobium faecis TaxID=2934158 RepID=UPI002118F837|nr:hypothetical protein [Ornithinimicrobium sp. HY1745]
MPTARPRVLVTETDDLTAALAAAEQAWPQETSRARLLTRLALLGSQSLAERGPEARAQRRRDFLGEPRETYRGMFPQGYRETLRDEWPP